jgi:signal transduction histidine kinase
MARSHVRDTHALVDDLRELAREASLGGSEGEAEAKRRLQLLATEISDCLARLESRLAASPSPAPSAPDPLDGKRDRLVALGRVTAEVGYQLNNLLALASTRLELMEIALRQEETGKAVANSGLAREYLRQAEALAVRLMDLSEQPAEKLRGDLNAIVRNTVTFVRLLAAYENIDFELDLSGNLPAVLVDPARWQQLLLSLIANAADAVGRRKGEGGRIRIATSVDSAETHVHLFVRDEGRGIAAQHLPRVFDPGFTTKAGGREGLGLTTCRRIVEEAGGTIKVASERGRGTTVLISLPALVQAPDRG